MNKKELPDIPDDDSGVEVGSRVSLWVAIPVTLAWIGFCVWGIVYIHNNACCP